MARGVRRPCESRRPLDRAPRPTRLAAEYRRRVRVAASAVCSLASYGELTALRSRLHRSESRRIESRERPDYNTSFVISFSKVSKQYGKQILFVDASFQLN